MKKETEEHTCWGYEHCTTNIILRWIQKDKGFIVDIHIHAKASARLIRYVHTCVSPMLILEVAQEVNFLSYTRGFLIRPLFLAAIFGLMDPWHLLDPQAALKYSAQGRPLYPKIKKPNGMWYWLDSKEEETSKRKHTDKHWFSNFTNQQSPCRMYQLLPMRFSCDQIFPRTSRSLPVVIIIVT